MPLGAQLLNGLHGHSPPGDRMSIDSYHSTAEFLFLSTLTRWNLRRRKLRLSLFATDGVTASHEQDISLSAEILWIPPPPPPYTPDTDKIYDALVIGGGPAGLSTALALGRVNRSCIVFSDDKFRNDGIHASHSVLSRDHVHPEEIRRIGREQIERYGNTEYAQARIMNISQSKLNLYAGFTVEDETGNQWQGRTVVLAMGVKDQFPDIEGYAENWPLNIYQCLFCDGYERFHLSKGVLGSPANLKTAAAMASMAHAMSFPPGSSRIADPSENPSSPVTIFKNGALDPTPDEATTALIEKTKAVGIAIDERPIKRLIGSKYPEDQDGGVTVVLGIQDGSTSEVQLGFVVDKPSTVPVGQHLIDQLGVETVTHGWATVVKSNPPYGTTSVKGVFVVGDLGTQMTQVTAAITSGVFAAAGVAHECIDQEEEIALEVYRRKASKSSHVTGQ